MKHISKWLRQSKYGLPPVLAGIIAAVMAVSVVAYVAVTTPQVKNVFEGGHVSCEVTEQFDGVTKSQVNVTNTGDVVAWLRVQLLSYRVNESGKRIGGNAPLPAFQPGAGWVFHDGFYYYTKPVQPGQQPEVPLIASMTLQKYGDADGGRQVVEVLAEAIQSTPDEAVHTGWGVQIAPDTVTPHTGS